MVKETETKKDRDAVVSMSAKGLWEMAKRSRATRRAIELQTALLYRVVEVYAGRDDSERFKAEVDAQLKKLFESGGTPPAVQH